MRAAAGDRMWRTTTVLLAFVVWCAVVVHGQAAPWGERMRTYGDSLKDWAGSTTHDLKDWAGSATHDLKDWAGSTTRDLLQQAEGGNCELCGSKTVRGMSRCLRCLHKTAPAEFKQWCDDTWRSTRETVETLRDRRHYQRAIDLLFSARDAVQSQRNSDSQLVLERNRQWYEQMTRLIMSRDNGEGGRLAREAVKRFAPSLEGTDFVEDPARAFSYFWALDGKGFVKRVRWLRGPGGKIVTMQEYLEQKTGADPQKSEDVVEIIDDVRKIATEDTREMAPAALDALARTLRLLTR
ncbi:MAG TPA: hypothetical protein PKO06_02815 [Candidatus Ozemobacteraceae bacterium]|nr:hypothetical protein [Candidatus Ozemobacteraceae bacterium]